MRAALVLPGGGMWPPQQKAHDLGCDRIGWTSQDPQIDPATNGGTNVVEAVRGNGFTVFLMRALWGWGGTPEGWADAFRADLGRLDLLKTSAHGARQCALNADLEVDDSEWVCRALLRLLAIMPGRGLTWSMQPHKGGIIGDELLALINSNQWVTVAPYLYRNNMQRCSERWVVDDLTGRGVKPQKILPYYRDVSEGWNGFLWDLAQVA